MTDYAKISATLKEALHLTGSPVAVKIVTSEDKLPEGISEIEETVRHCRMISLAREGKVFYAPDSKHQCGGGAWVLGLREIGESMESGEHYLKLGKYSSLGASKRTVYNVPALQKDTYSTVYAPLEKATFVPDVVIIFAKPFSMLKLAQSTLFRLGGRLYPEFSGIQSICSDATAYVLLNGEPNFSLGCDGSRKFSGIADDEMVAGFPAERLEELADALLQVTAAPGSYRSRKSQRRLRFCGQYNLPHLCRHLCPVNRAWDLLGRICDDPSRRVPYASQNSWHPGRIQSTVCSPCRSSKIHIQKYSAKSYAGNLLDLKKRLEGQ